MQSAVKKCSDSATLGAIARYSETVRSTAPWLPSNAEFLRRIKFPRCINGLGSVREVRDIIFSARYTVLGLATSIRARPAPFRSTRAIGDILAVIRG